MRIFSLGQQWMSDRYESRSRFWRSLSRASLAMLLAFIFLTFSVVGLLTTINNYQAMCDIAVH